MYLVFVMLIQKVPYFNHSDVSRRPSVNDLMEPCCWESLLAWLLGLANMLSMAVGLANMLSMAVRVS